LAEADFKEASGEKEWKEWKERTGKSVEECLELAAAEEGVPQARLDYAVVEQPTKGLFGFIGGKPAKIRYRVKPLEAVAVAREFLQTIFATIKVEASIEKLSSEDGTTLNIRGRDLGVLIGKRGQTLDALQYLTNLAANRDADVKEKILLDVEDYRKRRSEALASLALRMADKVKRRGERVVLEPMSPHERKVIHVALQNDSRITTYSEGEEPFRKVVIALKK